LLRRKNRAAYAKWKTGEYPSLWHALNVSGIKKAPSRLSLMKRNWKRATEEERFQFVEWITSIL
jgi:hypothetical protein